MSLLDDITAIFEKHKNAPNGASELFRVKRDILDLLGRRDDVNYRLLSREREEPSSPADLRGEGWTIAVHNDYRQDNEPHTFWLFTRGNECVKGEGRTDAEALDQIRAELERRSAPRCMVTDARTDRRCVLPKHDDQDHDFEDELHLLRQLAEACRPIQEHTVNAGNPGMTIIAILNEWDRFNQ